eukprot:g69322.t1
MIRKQHKLWADRKNNPTHESVRKHSRYRQVVKKAAKQEKREYLTAHLEQTKNNPKAQVAILRQILPRHATARESPKEIIYNNVSYKEPKDIADKMNKHFINKHRQAGL